MTKCYVNVRTANNLRWNTFDTVQNFRYSRKPGHIDLHLKSINMFLQLKEDVNDIFYLYNKHNYNKSMKYLKKTIADFLFLFDTLQFCIVQFCNSLHKHINRLSIYPSTHTHTHTHTHTRARAYICIWTSKMFRAGWISRKIYIFKTNVSEKSCGVWSNIFSDIDSLTLNCIAKARSHWFFFFNGTLYFWFQNLIIVKNFTL